MNTGNKQFPEDVDIPGAQGPCGVKRPHAAFALEGQLDLIPPTLVSSDLTT